MPRAVAEAATYWDALPALQRTAITSRIVELLTEGKATIPGNPSEPPYVMNPKMASRLLPGALAEFSLDADDVQVAVRDLDVLLTLRRGKPTGGMRV